MTFVLRLTSPPHNLMVILYSIAQVIRKFRQEPKRFITHILGVLFPFLWLGLGLALRYSSHMLTGGKLCEDSTSWGWFLDICRILGLLSLPTEDDPLFFDRPISVLPFVCCALLYLYCMGLLYLNRKELTPEWPLGVLAVFLLLSMLMGVYLSIEFLWPFLIIHSTITASGKNYALTYGQVCPLLCAFDI